MAECQRCSQAFTSHGHTHVHCPRCIGKRFREDILALAERTLYPGITYTSLTAPQRIHCIDWATMECIRRRLPGFGVNRRGEAQRQRVA
jgi:hypothetical protein